MTLRIRWHGTEFAAKLIEKLANGTARVEALEHGPRFAPGAELIVMANEIVSEDAPEPVKVDLDALEKALTTEREKLTPAAEVITDPNPMPPLSDQPAAANPIERDHPMSDTSAFARLQEKAKLAAGAATEVATAVEATFDDILARKAALLERNNTLHAQHRQIIDQANAGLDTIEGALRQLSNGGPAA